MFIKISQSKARYNQGQVFPFLIALIVVVIILTMITANLGQIGVFKTDVSNAADAAALAGASILSGALLGLGLRSDAMCGEMIVAVAAIIVQASSVVLIPAAVDTYIAILISEYVSFLQALGDGKMAWSNAKKSALQYAFQNVGIDEPRTSFENFIKNVYRIDDPDNLDPAVIASYYHVYVKGDDPLAAPDIRGRIKKFSQSGFSLFMEETGYWSDSWGEIEPGNISPAFLTSGYGWNALDGSNSYANLVGGDLNYKNYPDYVEVQVVANVMYPLEMYNPLSDIAGDINQWIEVHTGIPWWLTWIACPICWILQLVSWMWVLLPGGLKMDPIDRNTTNNPIMVTVRRFKLNTDVGLWNFRYGTIESTAQGHAYRQNGDEDIKPVLWSGLWEAIQSLFGGGGWDWDVLFKTKKHLFEAEVNFIK